ncbi:MAG: phage holin family protein [Paludibacteraceae bacterium]|nr:phage holin family protein [Paludibacteraceae bacterium]
MVTFLILALITALVICLSAWLLPGISVKNYGSAILVAIVVALLNAVCCWALSSLNINFEGANSVVSLLVSAFSLWMAGKLMKSFSVKNFWWALACAALIAVCSWFVPVL